MAEPRLPKVLYFVASTKAPVRRHGQPAGGKFTNLESAKERRDGIVKDGGEAQLFKADLVWEPVEEWNTVHAPR